MLFFSFFLWLFSLKIPYHVTNVPHSLIYVFRLLTHSLRTYRLQQMLDQMNRLVQNIDEDTAKLKIPISNPKITPNILNNTSPSQPLSTSSSSSSSSTSTHKEIKAEQNIAGTIDNTEAAQVYLLTFSYIYTYTYTLIVSFSRILLRHLCYL